MAVQSIEIEKEAKEVMFWFTKRHIKGENNQMDFAEYLRKSDVSENSKFYFYGRFLQNGLHERYCYISNMGWPIVFGREMIGGIG